MRRPAALAACAVVAAAVVLYAPTIHDYFLQDDFGVVGLMSQKPALYFPRWFVGPWTDNIWGYVPDEVRPFPALSYQIAAAFGAASPEPNHILNIAIHALNGLLVMGIAESAAGLGLFAAMAAGLIFVLLPIQAESVAWVTGRVDSLPACFYFASFLLFVRWRRSGQPASYASYAWSLALLFAALFSKQNTITLAPALVLFDWIVGRRRVELSWKWMRPYVPYVLLTAGFLLLRYVLFHEVARENVLSAERFNFFLSDSSRHLVRLVFGGTGIRHWALRDTEWMALAVTLLTMLAIRAPGSDTSTWRVAIYFGVIWIVLGMAPILVSGYYSPRHMYLASLGWAVAIGIGLEILWEAAPVRAGRAVAVAITAALVVLYGTQLRQVVRGWNAFAAISQSASIAIEREAMRSPEGTLVLAGVPATSWAFALPHALRPPFTHSDLTKRLLVISDSSLHCCDATQWNDYTRQALHTWQQRTDRPPVVAMYWDPGTGRMSRVSDQDDPQLRTLVLLLIETDSRETLDSATRGLLKNFVGTR